MEFLKLIQEVVNGIGIEVYIQALDKNLGTWYDILVPQKILDLLITGVLISEIQIELQKLQINHCRIRSINQL